jgi:Domain of unknown function (DUF4390)
MNRSGILLVLGMFFCSAIGAAADYGFAIKSAAVVPAKAGYVLNADIDYKLSTRSTDALKHGVPLTMVVKIRLHRYRRLIWNKTVFSKNLIFRLSYHALRNRYRVYDENSGSQQYYVNLEPAVEAMGQIRGLPVLNSASVTADTKYIAQIKAFLDIESLPLPLRSIAFLIPQWYIDSGWYTWSLDGLSRP